jgi:hypothetical protein
MKRNLLDVRSFARALAFIVLAPIHRVLHAIKAGEWFDVPNATPDTWFAVRASLREKVRQ